MTAVTAVTVALPDARELVAALAAIAGAEPTWYPAVVAGTGAEGRTCQVGKVEIFEVPGAVQLPESITLTVTDAADAVDRLRAAGFTVTEHSGLPAIASLTVAGVGIRIAAAA